MQMQGPLPAENIQWIFKSIFLKIQRPGITNKDGDGCLKTCVALRGLERDPTEIVSKKI